MTYLLNTTIMMNESHLLDGEYVIEQSEKLGIVVTNKRLKHLHWKFGKVQLQSVMLQDIEYMQVKWTHNVRLFPVILILLSLPVAFFLIVFLMSVLPFSGYGQLLFAYLFAGSILPIYLLSTVGNRLVVMTKNGKRLKIGIGRLSDQESFDLVNGIEKVMERQC